MRENREYNLPVEKDGFLLYKVIRARLVGRVLR